MRCADAPPRVAASAGSLCSRTMSAITVRAAVLERPGVRSRVEELELADPREGEVRVRMLASGVCHSDLHVRDGDWDRPGPIVMGHEGAGIIEALGPGVDAAAGGLEVGRLVALAWTTPCGRCRSCLAGRTWECPDSPSYTHLMPDGTSRLSRPGGTGDVFSYCAIGTMAEAQVVPVAAVVPMPDGTPPEVAALIGCCVATGVGAVTKTVAVAPGASVAVIGLGGVGLSAVMGAVIAGAGRIVAVDRVPAKLDLARSVGATAAVLAGDDASSTVAAIRDATDGGPDVCVEAIGLPSTIEIAIGCLPNGGTALLIGMTPFGCPGVVRGLPVRRRGAANRRLELWVRRTGGGLPPLRPAQSRGPPARRAPRDRPDRTRRRGGGLRTDAPRRGRSVGGLVQRSLTRSRSVVRASHSSGKNTSSTISRR